MYPVRYLEKYLFTQPAMLGIPTNKGDISQNGTIENEERPTQATLTTVPRSRVVCKFQPINGSFATVPGNTCATGLHSNGHRMCRDPITMKARHSSTSRRAPQTLTPPPLTPCDACTPRQHQAITHAPTDVSISQLQPTGQSCWCPSLRPQCSARRRRPL